MNNIGDKMVDIKRIFYEKIIPEATLGKIKALVYYGVVFNTNIVEDNKYYKCNIDNPDILIPTLIIKDKELFDKLLEEYVIKALDFYDNNNFYDEILDYKMYDEKDMVCKEKVILAYLFANATSEDFNNPVAFLRKRIDFIDNHMDSNCDLGYSNTLGANIELLVEKDTINNETPSRLVFKAYKDEEELVFPMVKFGISNNKVYIYAIQNEKQNNNTLSKKINRKLYGVGEGFINEDLYENPKDITASFLVVLNMAISYFYQMGYSLVEVPSILIERWNAKKIANNNMYKRKKINEKELNERNVKQEIIQSNLTNKLIRTFLRLGCHYNNIDVLALPYELDDNLHIGINHNVDILCNNKLLDDTYQLVSKGINKKITK